MASGSLQNPAAGLAAFIGKTKLQMPGSAMPGPGIKMSRIHCYSKAMHRAQCLLLQLSKMGCHLSITISSHSFLSLMMKGLSVLFRELYS